MQSSMSRDAEKLFYLPPEFELPAIGEVVGNDVNYHLRVLFERVMEDSATDSESQEGSNHTSSVDPETLDGALEGSCVFSRFTENRIRSRPRPGDEVHNGSNAARGVQTPIFTFGAYSCGCIAQDVSFHFLKALILVIPCPLDGTRLPTFPEELSNNPAPQMSSSLQRFFPLLFQSSLAFQDYSWLCLTPFFRH